MHEIRGIFIKRAGAEELIILFIFNNTEERILVR